MQNHRYVPLMWTIKMFFLFVCIQTTFLLFWEYYESSVGRNKADKTPENTCSLSHENSPSQQYSPVTLTPLRSVILVNMSDSSQENHHYRIQCSKADGTDKNKAIPSRQLHLFWIPTHSTAAAAPELFRLILSTEILAFHTLIESLILKGADAEWLTTL